MKYLLKDGSTADRIPNPADYIKDEEDLIVEHEYQIVLYDVDHKVIARDSCGSAYPNNCVIKWYLLKYHASYANVEKLYVLR